MLHDGVIALSLHDVETQEEIAWAGKRTALSDEIGVAVTERMDGAAVRRICDGFKAIGRGTWSIRRDAFTLESDAGRELEHIAVRLERGSRFVLSALFRPGLSAGLRKVVETAALSALCSELRENSRAGISVPR